MMRGSLGVVLVVVALAAVASAAGARNETYAERCAWYARFSAEQGGRDIWADVARAHVGVGVLSEAWRDAVAQLYERRDGSDFILPAIAMLLFQYPDSPVVTAEARAGLRQALLDFQYWPDELGYHGNLQYWSENHAVLYHASEYVIGHHLAGETFSNSGLTGAQHRDKGRALLLRWLDLRSRLGFNEYASEVYNTFLVTALATVVDLGPDAEVVTRAQMVLDLVLLDLSLSSFAGLSAGFRGRSYESNKLSISAQSTSRVIWLLNGEGTTFPAGRGAVSLAVSRKYALPGAIEAVAQDRPREMVATGRTGIATAEGPKYGLGYTDPADGIVWFGMGAYADPLTIELFFIVPTAYDMWEHEVWAPLEPLRPLAGTGLLPLVAELVFPLSKGAVLGPISTSFFRTPFGSLGGAVEYNTGYAAFQQHIWQATLGPDTLVFASHPGPNPSDYALSTWTGGASIARVSQHKHVLVALHQPPWPTPLDLLYLNFTHAYFPRANFDEVRQAAGWTFGRLGDGYVGLYSARPTRWVTTGEYADRELVAEGGAQNVWIAEIGSPLTDASFDAFVARLSGGTVDASWEPGAVGGGGDGLVACIVRNECLDPADPVGSLTDCLVRIPVVNPNPPCQAYLDVAGVTRCVAACGAEDAACQLKCIYTNAVIDPPVFAPGEIRVAYTDTRGRTVTYSSSAPLTVAEPGAAPVVVQPEQNRFRNPYVTAPWDARQFTVTAAGRVLELDFDVPSRVVRN